MSKQEVPESGRVLTFLQAIREGKLFGDAPDTEPPPSTDAPVVRTLFRFRRGPQVRRA